MSIARAFTTRNKKPEMHITAPMYIGRAASQRAGRPVLRAQISSPMALISTSNTMLNNAQDIAGTSTIDLRAISSGSSIISSSASDSDASSSRNTSGTITDASSIEESPVNAEPNHLSCYFKPAVDTGCKSPGLSPPTSSCPSFDTPTVPQRVPSHSKQAHERVHRQRSIRRMLSPPPTNRDVRGSADIFSAKNSSFVEAPKESPFGSELAQLDEVAEEFGQVVCDAESQADKSAMQSHDLAYFAASDYLSEIQSLIYSTFQEPEQDFAGWI